MQTYFSYIVKCADGTYYSGSTSDIQRRIRQHNGELAGGAKYTRGRRPVTLGYIEEFATQQQAAKREHEFKQLTHKQKGKLCK
jgi:putative endonuclease